MNKYFMDKYKQETCELLAELEASLLDLDETPDDTELTDRILGTIHTIKGVMSFESLESVILGRLMQYRN